MPKLSPAETDCLRRLSQGQATLEPCRADLLEGLERMGLIEHAPALRYPLTSLHVAYRLTEEGWRRLRE